MKREAQHQRNPQSPDATLTENAACVLLTCAVCVQVTMIAALPGIKLVS